MNNFEFYNPTKLVFGKNSIGKIKDLLPKNKNVLLLYGGGSIKKNGVYDQVIKALEGFSVTKFSGIEPNPKYETLMKAVELIKQKNIEFLLPVGGGSVIDGTKFIAAAVKVNDDPWGILTGKIKVESALPIGTVLTLPATGTEMNGNSVVSRESTQEKLAFGSIHVYPKFSILDPQTCFSLPEDQIANGITDAFIHVMEQYLTYPVNTPLQDRMAESILQTLIETAPIVLKDKNNYDAMANFMWSATMALNGAISRGAVEDWSTHIIGHEITAFHGLDHAKTLAIVLPGVMNIMRENKKEKILQYGQRVWNINSGTEKERIDAAIEKTASFFESVGIKTHLSDYKIGKETIDKICKRFADRKSVFGERGDITPEVVNRILTDRL